MGTHLKGKLRRTAATAFGLLIAASLMIGPITGCGDEDTTGKTATRTTADTVTATDVALDRSQPGRVSITDETGESLISDESAAPIPAWLDIGMVSIASDGDNYVFETTLAEAIPQPKPTGVIGVEWGFVIDTNSDGEPDYGLYASYQTDTLSYGLFNPVGGERQADTTFPGSFAVTNNTLSWTLSATAIGQPEAFQWVAYTDAAANSGGEQSRVVKSGDKVPANGWPGADWLIFP